MSATVSRSLWVGCLVVSGRLAVDNAQQGLKPQKNATRRGQQCCWTACATVPFWRRSSVGATARKHQFLITHTDNSELRKSCLLLTCCGLVSERELYWRILPSWITKHEAKQQPQNQCAQQDLMVSQFPWEKKKWVEKWTKGKFDPGWKAYRRKPVHLQSVVSGNRCLEADLFSPGMCGMRIVACG